MMRTGGSFMTIFEQKGTVNTEETLKIALKTA